MNASSRTQPPCDLDAEAAVLSAALLSPEAFDEARHMLGDGEAFYAERHRHIWAATCSVWDQGGEPDLVTIAGELRRSGRLDQVGGVPYLAEVVDATPAVAHVAEHARAVRDTGAVRKLMSELETHLSLGRARLGDPRAWLERAEGIVFKHAEVRTESPAGELVGAIAARAYALAGQAARGEVHSGSTTGLPELDEHTGGLEAGALWYLAARPGMGKSGLLWGFLEAVARAGELAILFSLEMKRIEVTQRAQARGAAVFGAELSSRRVARGALSHDEWSKVAGANTALAALPLIIDDTEDITPNRMRSRVRRYLADARRRWPEIRLGAVGVDYLQLLDSDERHDTENARLEATSRKLKKMAREFETCVVCASQLNRGVEAKNVKDKRPGLADLRGSGAIEQDADVVLFVYRDDYYRRKEEKPDGLAELIVGKGRSSGPGKIWARFEAPWTSFYPLHEEYPQRDLGLGADDAAE